MRETVVAGMSQDECLDLGRHRAVLIAIARTLLQFQKVHDELASLRTTSANEMFAPD